jgi:dTMP kinase
MVAQVWQTLVLLDYYLQVLVKIKLRSRPGRLVICDRYVPDFLVDLGVNFGYGEEEIPRFFKTRLLSLFPKPDLIFLLDIPEDVAFKRKDDVSLSYLRDRRALYLSFGKLQGMEILNGAANIQDLREIVYQRTLEYFYRRREERSRKKSSSSA